MHYMLAHAGASVLRAHMTAAADQLLAQLWPRQQRASIDVRLAAPGQVDDEHSEEEGEGHEDFDPQQLREHEEFTKARGSGVAPVC